MASVNISIREKQARIEARQELQKLNSDELTALILDTLDPKTLAVITASLKIARTRGERVSFSDRETARLRSVARKKVS